MTTTDGYKEEVNVLFKKGFLTGIARLSDIAKIALKEVAMETGAKELDFTLADAEAQTLTPDERVQAIVLAWAVLRN
jgi:hypothetical protein